MTQLAIRPVHELEESSSRPLDLYGVPTLRRKRPRFVWASQSVAPQRKRCAGSSIRVSDPIQWPRSVLWLGVERSIFVYDGSYNQSEGNQPRNVKVRLDRL